MSATALPSEDAAPTRIPQAQRAHSRLSLEARAVGGRTVTGAVAEAGHARVRFPRSGRRTGALEAVLLNTGGGIAGGDTMAHAVTARTGARLVVTSQAAEKVYRSDGSDAELHVRLTVESGARLDWMPQPTILFDAARVVRSISAELAPDARLLIVEQVILGRTARGETFERGRLQDQWRVRRGGRLVYADGLDLGSEVGRTLRRPAVAAGWPAFATVLLVAPDAEARLPAVREALGLPDALPADLEAGASAWDGMLSVRLLARHGAALEGAIRRLMGELGLAETPRIWHS
ncbi:urease accessory protein UreD [Ancylobacter lacus]|nr:urease accessory protein UreD [Ancylobacter lacus]MBS7540295.1 urease accessory protein UreD [Ancylobacter lacus]